MAKTKRKKTSSKKNFLAIFLGTPAAMKRWDKLPAKTKREREVIGLQAWDLWVKQNKLAIVNLGAPLGATKRIDRKGVRSTRNQMAAYTVVSAPSHAAAAKIFRNHPHFMIFPGEAIEVMECFKIPGM